MSLKTKLDAQDRAVRKLISNESLLILSEIRKALRNVRASLGEIYAKYGDNVTHQEMMKFNRLSKYEKQLIDEIKRLSGITLTSISNSLSKVFEESYYRTGWALEKETLFKFGFRELNRDVIKASVENPLDRVGWKFRSNQHHVTTIMRMRSELTQGLIEGKGFSRTAGEIKGRLNNLANDILRIVRTEGHRVLVKGRLEGIERAEAASGRLGVKVVRVLSSVLDSRTRSQSSSMDGQEADENGLFLYPNGVRGLPGQTGVPGYDINDRETVIVRIDESERSKNYKNEALSQYDFFEDWKKDRVK